MLTGHRYRVILYFAVLVLCLSVCFAFAEEPALVEHYSASTSQGVSDPSSASIHFLYYSVPGRASFLPALSSKLITEPVASAVQIASADAILKQLGTQADHHRNLHTLFSGKRHARLVRSYAPTQPLKSMLPASSKLAAEE